MRKEKERAGVLGSYGYNQSFALQDLTAIAREEKDLNGIDLISQMTDDEGKTELQKRLIQRQQEGRKKGRPRKEENENNTRMTFVVDKDQLEKLRYIAYKKRQFVKEVIFDFFADGIARYEKNNGIIETKKKDNENSI